MCGQNATVEMRKPRRGRRERAGVCTNQTTENSRKKKQETAEEPGDRVAPARRGNVREATEREAGHGLQIRRTQCAVTEATPLER